MTLTQSHVTLYDVSPDVSRRDTVFSSLNVSLCVCFPIQFKSHSGVVGWWSR
jgi:hypothetical protein